jgi:hypothetical protein
MLHAIKENRGCRHRRSVVCNNLKFSYDITVGENDLKLLKQFFKQEEKVKLYQENYELKQAKASEKNIKSEKNNL